MGFEDDAAPGLPLTNLGLLVNHFLNPAFPLEWPIIDGRATMGSKRPPLTRPETHALRHLERT